VQCPICRNSVSDGPRGDDAKHFPFCSERCKLIDLGRWLEGRYQIPVEDDSASAEPDRTDPDPADDRD
jgi:hypothetical protein